MDHFTVTECGRLYTSMGKTTSDLMYTGSCIVVDHATGDVHVEHLLNFTTTVTLQAKARYGKHMADMGSRFRPIKLTTAFLPHVIS